MLWISFFNMRQILREKFTTRNISIEKKFKISSLNKAFCDASEFELQFFLKILVWNNNFIEKITSQLLLLCGVFKFCNYNVFLNSNILCLF